MPEDDSSIPGGVEEAVAVAAAEDAAQKKQRRRRTESVAMQQETITAEEPKIMNRLNNGNLHGFKGAIQGRREQGKNIMDMGYIGLFTAYNVFNILNGSGIIDPEQNRLDFTEQGEGSNIGIIPGIGYTV